MDDNQKTRPTNLTEPLLFIIIMVTILVGYFMVAKTVVAEGDGIRQKINIVVNEVTDLKNEIETLKNKVNHDAEPELPSKEPESDQLRDESVPPEVEPQDSTVAVVLP